MRYFYIFFGLLVTVVAGTHKTNAQYYDWGQDPARIKWYEVRGDNGKLVFPDYYRGHATRLMNYMDSLRNHVGYGFRHGPMRLPLVTHTQNFSPNGIVMLAPKRMEFIVTPPANTFAMPWLKQLAVHEYRHAVQYENVNQGIIKVLSYVLGQQGSLVGAALLPYWLLEGDAVLTETQMSNYGRGVQPSFTIEYRAMALEGKKKYPADKYFSGSFVDFMPDHYQLGYQIASYAYTKYNENIWDKVAWFGARNAYMILTTKISLNKYYNTSVNKLFAETRNDLWDYWRSLPVEDNTADIVVREPKFHTVYQSPVSPDGVHAYSLKTDMQKTTRLVRTDLGTGREEVLLRTGSVNTGLVEHAGRLWWTEFRQSTFWEQRINSTLCWYEPATGGHGVVRNARQVMFPAGSRDNEPAYVAYDYSGVYSIRHRDWEVVLPGTVSVHGLAYDNAADIYYFIALDDNGMWIGSSDRASDTFDIVKRPSFATLSGLRCDGGMLYYTSIASGKDEAHKYDPGTGVETRITTSRYGSFEPSAMPTGSTVMTTYTPKGYLLSVQDAVASPDVKMDYRAIPDNKVNPDRIKWDVMNMDSVVLGDTSPRRTKRYRRGLHLFQFHSWAPVHFEPDKIMDESRFNVHVGASVLGQNLLNTMFTTFGYKYTDEGSALNATIRYFGWAPKFELEAEYGFRDQDTRIRIAGDYNKKLKNHFEMTGRVYLPFLLASGYHIRRLTPLIEINHNNMVWAKPLGNGRYDYDTGVQKVRYSLQYSDVVRMSDRDFLPRWGYMARVSTTTTPFNKYFGRIMSAYGRVYLPGVAQHHSLMLRGTAQKQGMSLNNFNQKELFPRGADFNYSPNKYGALSADYQLPVWYPDGGIKSLVYFRRVRANLFYDIARFRMVSAQWNINTEKVERLGSMWKNIRSYGGEISIDMVPLRLPATNMSTVTFGIYKTSEYRENRHNKVVFSLSASLPL